MKHTLTAGLVAVASAVVFAQTPSSATGQNASQGNTQGNRTSSGEQTLTGCLTSADNIFTLTVMDDSGAPGTTAETIAYTLAPGSGVDLKGHLNKRITVKGTDAGPDAQSSNRVVMNTPAAPAATGTSGRSAAGATDSGANRGNTNGNQNAGQPGNQSNASGANGSTPMVQTSAKARITQKTFNVTSVQPANGNCGA
ncbi:MAG: hypothetical protein JSU08_09035 [Acidobacteria bacterium]|nr:hypothetical protein [Acidobacteriota bacterium]